MAGADSPLYRANIGPTGRASGGPRISLSPPGISDGIGPGPPEPGRASLFQVQARPIQKSGGPGRAKNRAGSGGLRAFRAGVAISGIQSSNIILRYCIKTGELEGAPFIPSCLK